MRQPRHVSTTSWQRRSYCRWQFVLVTYISLCPFSSHLYGFYHFFSLFLFLFFLPLPSLLSILFQPFLLFFQNENFYHVYATNFTTRLLMIAFIDCLLYAKHHSKLFVYIFILTSSMYYCSESEGSNNLPKFTKPIRNK